MRRPSRKRVPDYQPEQPTDEEPARRKPAQTAHANRDSNAVRASVFDMFYELGGLEANSRIAHWIFDDPSVPDENPVRAVMFREDSGSRFRERLDSLGPASILPPEQLTPISPSKSFWHFSKKTRPRVVQRDTESKHKSVFLRFKSKSATHLPDTIKEKVPPVPPTPQTPRPPLSPAATFNEEEWERVSYTSSPGIPKQNPFLAGPPPDGVPFPALSPTKDSGRFSFRASLLPSHPPRFFRNSKATSFSTPSPPLDGLTRARSHI